MPPLVSETVISRKAKLGGIDTFHVVRSIQLEPSNTLQQPTHSNYQR